MTTPPPGRGALPPAGTIQIPLLRGEFAIISADDADKIKGRTWYRTFYGYVAASGGKHGKLAWLHRVIMDAPRGFDVDHIDGNRLNNTRENLRICSRAENLWNSRKHKDSASPFKGVTYLKRENRWLARVMASGVCHYVGRFDTPEAARDARHALALKLHGQFARTEDFHAL